MIRGLGLVFLHLLQINKVDKILLCPMIITRLLFPLDNKVWYMSLVKSFVVGAVVSCHPSLNNGSYTDVVLCSSSFVQFNPVWISLFLNH